MKEKIAVAMSGGVDSSVAAALLKEEGYEVVGVTMELWDAGEEEEGKYRGGCCSLEDTRDAKAVARQLDIPHYVLNLREQFQENVMNAFIDEYKNGRTPNPCILCNRWVKFHHLWEKMKKLGVGLLATGHYARIEYNEKSKKYGLFRGRDTRKDQSYVLYMLSAKDLGTLKLPLGKLTKKEVRALAGKFSLPVQEKAESQEICFVPDNDYGRFIESRFPKASSPGLILDLHGRMLGEHKGVIHYTVGQRRKIGLADAKPYYVARIDGRSNTLYVGREEELYSSLFAVKDLNWVGFSKLKKPMKCAVKIRYLAPLENALVAPMEPPDESTAGASPETPWVTVETEKPLRAITPGEAAVFYDEDEVLGGGTIVSTGPF